MTAKLRIGFIGAGRIGVLHAGVLYQQVPDALLVAIQDPRREAAERLLEFLASDTHTAPHVKNLDQIRVHRDYREMLAAGGLDAVFVLSPHTLHFEHAAAALERGLHVLVEKPLTCSVEHARALARTARRRKRVLMAAYQRRYTPVFGFMRGAVEQRMLGDIVLVTAYQVINGDQHKNTWRMDPRLAGGGHLSDSGSHLLDNVLWVSGLKARSVFASIDTGGHKVDVTDALTIVFRNGARGSVAVSSGVRAGYAEEMAFWGNRGGLLLRDGQLTLYGKDGKPAPADAKQYPPADRPEKAFVRAVLSGATCDADLDTAVDVVKLTQAAYASNKQGKPVTLR